MLNFVNTHSFNPATNLVVGFLPCRQAPAKEYGADRSHALARRCAR
jgi:hypothetical protein